MAELWATWFKEEEEHAHSSCIAMRDNYKFDVTYLNFAKVFDKVDYNMLLTKLTASIRGNTFERIKKCIQHGKHSVLVNGEAFESVGAHKTLCLALRSVEFWPMTWEKNAKTSESSKARLWCMLQSERSRLIRFVVET